MISPANPYQNTETFLISWRQFKIILRHGINRELQFSNLGATDAQSSLFVAGKRKDRKEK